MAMKEIFVFFACIFMLSGFGGTVDIQCGYRTNSYDAVGSVYECVPLNTLNIKTRESAVINSVSGSHQSGKNNAYVTGFYSSSSSRVIEYFPRNLENIFTNLKMILIYSGRLKEIQQNDLRPFTKLVHLYLYQNDIEFLEDGLFAYNPELALVSFESNKIIYIGNQVFDNLNKLAWLYLHGNTCIDMEAGNNQTLVRQLIIQAKVKCFGYSGIDKDLQKLENSLLCVNSESLPIFDQNLQNLQSRFHNSTLSQSWSLKERFRAITTWKSKNIWTVKEKMSTIETSLANSKTEVLNQIGSLKTDMTTIKNTQTSSDKAINEIQQKSSTIQSSINQLINSQTQTCSAITENVSKVSQSLNAMNQDMVKKSDSTDIKNSINNLKSDIATKLSTIGSDLNTKFTSLNSYLTAKIEMEVKQMSQSQSQGLSTLTDKLTRTSDKVNEVKITQQDIQQKTGNIEKHLKDLLGSHNASSSIIADRITKVDTSLSEIIKQKSDDIQKSMTTSHDGLRSDISDKTLKLKGYLKDHIEQKTTDLDKSMDNRITTLEANLNIALRGIDANITNVISSRTFNMSKLISDIESTIINRMTSIKDDLSSEVATVNESLSAMGKNMTSLIGSYLSTNLTNLNSYLAANIEMEVKQMSQSQSQGLSTLTDKVTSTNNILTDMKTQNTQHLNKINEVKITQEDIQQKSGNIEKHLKDLLGSHNASSSAMAERIIKVDTSLSEIIKQKSDDIQKSMTTSHDELKTVSNKQMSAMNQSLTNLKDQIEQKTTDLDKSINGRITTLEANLNIALRGKEANITNDVSSRTFNMSKRISDIETAMNNGMMSIKDDLATEISSVNEKLSTMESNMTSIKSDLSLKLEDINSNLVQMEASMDSKVTNLNASIIKFKTEVLDRMNDKSSIMEIATNKSLSSIDTINSRMTSIESNVNTKLSSMDAKISNLTSILQDFIKLSTRSSNRFQSELKDRLQVTNYKIDESSIIQDYTKSMLIGSCALLVTLVLVIIYKKILSQPDDLDY